MKKTNAVTSLLLSLCLFAHAGLTCYMLIANVYLGSLSSIVGRATATILLVHTIVSFINLGRAKAGKIDYVKLNIKTLLQRILGTWMVLLTVPHIVSLKSLFGPSPMNTVLICAIQVVFFVTVFVHIAISTSKALISLGWIGSSSCERKVNAVMFCVCGLALVVTVVTVVGFVVAVGGR